MGPGGGTTIFTESVLVVNQRPKYLEMSYEYAICDRRGDRLGSVRQVGQSAAKKVFRLLTDWDEDFRHALQVLDLRGNVVLEVISPSALFRNSKAIVRDGNGNEVGRVVERNFSECRLLDSRDATFGSIVRVPDTAGEFSIRDLAGTEVAHVTETLDDSLIRFLSKMLLTTANDYVVEIHGPLDDPLRRLVTASALALDLIFNQG
jgi:uncharacterized protein YxjI